MGFLALGQGLTAGKFKGTHPVTGKTAVDRPESSINVKYNALPNSQQELCQTMRALHVSTTYL